MSVGTLKHELGPGAASKFIKMMLLTGIPFGLFMGILWSFQYGWKSGVVMGTVGGLFFGGSWELLPGTKERSFKWKLIPFLVRTL